MKSSRTRFLLSLGLMAVCFVIITGCRRPGEGGGEAQRTK